MTHSPGLQTNAPVKCDDLRTNNVHIITVWVASVKMVNQEMNIQAGSKQ